MRLRRENGDLNIVLTNNGEDAVETTLPRNLFPEQFIGEFVTYNAGDRTRLCIISSAGVRADGTISGCFSLGNEDHTFVYEPSTGVLSMSS